MRYSLDERQIARLKPLVLGHTAARFIELPEDIDDVAPWDKVVRVLQADGLEIGRITMGEAFALDRIKMERDAPERQGAQLRARDPRDRGPCPRVVPPMGGYRQDQGRSSSGPGSERGRGPGARAERRAGVPSPAGRGMKQAGAPSGALRERSSRVIERFEKWVESGRFEDRFGRILDALESPTGRAAVVLALIVLVLIVEALSRTR